MLEKKIIYMNIGERKKIEKRENQPLKGRDGKDESKMLELYIWSGKDCGKIDGV